MLEQYIFDVCPIIIEFTTKQLRGCFYLNSIHTIVPTPLLSVKDKNGDFCCFFIYSFLFLYTSVGEYKLGLLDAVTPKQLGPFKASAECERFKKEYEDMAKLLIDKLVDKIGVKVEALEF